MRQDDDESGSSAEQAALKPGAVGHLPAGVALVRNKQIVTGLRVDSDGL
ncbi:MAG: hypothetical protein ABI775_11295 [Pseudonocardiales bacterium]